MNRVVMLDPGHGGEDPGVVVKGQKEKDLNLPLTLLLGGYLGPKGVYVCYTRQLDTYVPVGRRLQLATSIQPQAFISIHNNYDPDPKVHGFEIFYRDKYDKPLADAVGHFMRRTDLHERGIFNDVDRLGRHLAVLNNVPVPAILVECGFMSNEDDLKYVSTNKAALAEVIGAGVLDFLKIKEA